MELYVCTPYTVYLRGVDRDNFNVAFAITWVRTENLGIRFHKYKTIVQQY